MNSLDSKSLLELVDMYGQCCSENDIENADIIHKKIAKRIEILEKLLVELEKGGLAERALDRNKELLQRS